MTFPSGGEELDALADNWESDLARWKVGAYEVRLVLVEQHEYGHGDQCYEP